MKRRSKICSKAVETRRGKAAKLNRPSRSKFTPKHRFTETSQEADVARLTRERDELVEREKASAEVLRVISSSPGELEPVFQTILVNAARICGAALGLLWLVEGDGFRVIALHGARPELIALLRREPTIHPGPRAPLPRVAATKQLLHIADMAEDVSYKEGDPAVVNFVKIAGARTVLMVPLVKDREFIGALSIYRSAVHLFAEKQVDLVKNFAAQAVIAIENARLLSELRQRTADLTESLEQQTATAEVLRVISSSAGELAPVFNAILDNATRICDAKFGNLLLFDGKNMRVVAMHNAPIEHENIRRREPVINLRRSICGPIVRTKKIFSILDMTAEEPYAGSALARAGGGRTALAVPMLQEDKLVGAITIFRQEVRAFSERQIALVQNFAAQAVIAIENTRLLNELRRRTDDLTKSLEQQTATSEVLSAISESRGELQPVFQAMLANATRLCDAQFGNLFLREGDNVRLGATRQPPSANPEWWSPGRLLPLRETPNIPIARLVKSKAIVHVPDMTLDQAYIERTPLTVTLVESAGIRTFIAVPMLHEGELIGGLALYRQRVRPFTDKQITLLQNFAAQAVIAIENARLLNELRESLDQQTATANVLHVISSSPGDVKPVFETVLQKAVALCDAKFGTLFSFDGEQFHLAAQFGTPRELQEMQIRRGAFRPIAGGLFEQVMQAKQVSCTIDEAAEPVPGLAFKFGGARSTIRVPMLKDDRLAGVLVIYRTEVRPFSDKQIELLQNFAAQAVIAIENTRLLTELRERTEQVEARSRELKQLNLQLEERVTEQVAEIERMGRLRRFLPPQVADLIVASGAEKQLESHRREITALFCDLRGFTGFSESADPEDVMALLRNYHAAIGEIIIRYSGTLERYAGDGVMVVFNDPVPVPKPALQAVQAALDMRQALEALTGKWSRLGHDLGYGIGIAHGYATLGTIGFEGRFDYAAIGTVSNVASRLCDEAKAGQILISPRVLIEVEDAVTVEPVGEFALKGIRRPLAAHNVVALRSAT